MRIPLSAPDIIERDIEAVVRVLRTPVLSLGERLNEFERLTCEYVGVSHAVAVSSGTAGLHLCIRALGIREGDEVIVPSFSFIAVANVVRYERAIPVFVDIDPHTLNLDPQRAEQAITPQTRAILLAHNFGCPAELSELLEIARRHKLFVIEDACEAIGAEYDGRKVGPFGDMGVFAFYPNKQITTGEGGMIVTNNGALANLARSLRNQGRGDSSEWLHHTEIGYNYRISEMNCALGIEQLKRIDEILNQRERVAKEYNSRLGNIPELTLPLLSVPRRKISWFVYVVRLNAAFNRAHRDWIHSELIKRGIGCGKYFAPIHQQPAYLREPSRRTDLTVTENVSERTLALPFFNRLTNDRLEEVCYSLKELIVACRSKIPESAHS
jgi:perosamine synthetase